VASRNGGAALFSVTSDMEDTEWLKYSAELEKDIIYLSLLVHERARKLQSNGPEIEEQAVTLMEKSCLQWIAEGHTMIQVAEKLSVSERTVRMYLSSARMKLGANNTIHAITKLLRAGQLY